MLRGYFIVSKVMTKDPAFLFYPNDFLSGTYTMDNEQIGKYIKLLCLQHQKGHLTEKDMLKICNTYDDDIFNKFIKDNDGNYYNKRLKDESIRRKNYAESRRQNRLGKGLSKSYDKHMETETITVTKTKDEKLILEPPKANHTKEKETFEIFRKKYYGKKTGLETEFKNFIKKHKDWREVLPLLLPAVNKQIEEREAMIERQKKDRNVFVAFPKHLKTWINNRSWEEETVEEQAKKGGYRNL